LFWILYCLFNKGSKELFEKPQKFANKVEQIVKEKDPGLHEHLISHDVEFSSAVHGWLVKLLLPVFRKLPLMAQLWDRYMIAANEFWNFHSCVCAGLFLFFEAKIKEKQESTEISDFLIDLSVPEWDHTNMSKFVTFVCQIAEERGVWRRVHNNWLVVMRTKGVEPLPPEPEEPDWKPPIEKKINEEQIKKDECELVKQEVEKEKDESELVKQEEKSESELVKQEVEKDKSKKIINEVIGEQIKEGESELVKREVEEERPKNEKRELNEENQKSQIEESKEEKT